MLHSSPPLKALSNLGKETTATMLSEDLISEILVRLPVKSLLRFRCVCKAWFHLIDSPNFIDEHLKHSTTKTDRILLYRDLESIQDGLESIQDGLVSFHDYESFDFITQFHLDSSLQISGPCNGLLCLLDGKDEFQLVNLSTKTGIDLPSSPFLYRKGWLFYIDAFGFGFDSNQNDYKVVVILSYYKCRQITADEPSNKVEIYNVSTDSWRDLECDCQYYMDYDRGYDAHGTLFNGALHWTSRKNDTAIIPSFSLSTEVFQDLKFPSDLLGKYDISNSLTVLNDCLALISFTKYGYHSEEQFVEIWVMKEYAMSESWTKQVRIGPLSRITRPFFLWKNEALLFKCFNGQIQSCALDTQEIQEVEVQCHRGTSMRIMVYQESLISLE